MSNNIKIKKVWLIGAGSMANEYIKVLKDSNCNFTVIGRSEISANTCEELTGVSVIRGGVEKYLASNPSLCSHAIVCVGVNELCRTTKILLEAGIKNILVEKPVSLDKLNLIKLKEISERKGASVQIGYNRRFYSSSERAKEIIKEDGGVTSFNFEFTEWGHIIEKLDMPSEVLNTWFLGNSTHVVDLAFYLGGTPTVISSFTSGNLDWHKSSSVFVGAGVSDTGALFSYQANWGAPGRWSVEMLTNKHRLIFRPMEKLQIQNIGSVSTEFIDIDDTIDLKYKPGLYLQIISFLNGDFSEFCSLDYQIKMFDIYLKMANY